MQITALRFSRTVKNYGHPKFRKCSHFAHVGNFQSAVKNCSLTQATSKITAAIINAFARIKDPTANKGFTVS